MLKEIRDFLASLGLGREAGTAAFDEVQLSAAALVVHLAYVDGAFSTRESIWLRQAVATYTGLSGAEAERFLEAARQVDQERGDFSESVEALRRRLPPDQRLNLVALLWRCAMADGVLHEFEDDFIARIAELLGLSPPEAEAIRAAELAR
ncbi:MAG: TerB family tellurite resistance protein [Alsobacter sp.]